MAIQNAYGYLEIQKSLWVCRKLFNYCELNLNSVLIMSFQHVWVLLGTDLHACFRLCHLTVHEKDQHQLQTET